MPPKPCRARPGDLPCAPLNHEIRTAKLTGVVLVDRWFCSCGREMPAPQPSADYPREGESRPPDATAEA